jgi:hypothetical protein
MDPLFMAEPAAYCEEWGGGSCEKDDEVGRGEVAKEA